MNKETLNVTLPFAPQRWPWGPGGKGGAPRKQAQGPPLAGLWEWLMPLLSCGKYCVLGAGADSHFSGWEFCGIHLASSRWDFGLFSLNPKVELFSLVEGLCVHFVKVWPCFEQWVEHGACLDVGKQKRWPWMMTVGQLWAPRSSFSSSPEELLFCFRVTQARGFYF